MSIAAIVGRGFGPDASISFVVTRGFGISVSPEPVAPQGGGGAYPEARRGSKRGRRPIWDRLPESEDAPYTIHEPVDVIETVSEAAPPEPGDLSSLVKLLAPAIPEIETAATPLSVKKTPARVPEFSELGEVVVSAAGAIVDDDDAAVASGIVETPLVFGEVVELDVARSFVAIDVVGVALLVDQDTAAVRSRVAVVGRASMVEDADTLSAVASWDDDDLVVRLLLMDGV